MLRRQAGEPPYRAMARRAGVSATVLSQAAKGERLPTLQTTLAFIRACGGDAAAEREWRHRWEQVRAALHRRPAPAADPDVQATPPALHRRPAPALAPDVQATPPAPSDDGAGAATGVPRPAAAGPDGVAGERGMRLRWPVFAALMVICASLGAAGTVLVMNSIGRTAAPPAPAAPASAAGAVTLAPPRHIRDGEDPYLHGCRPDQQPLERQPIYRTNGTFYGWLILFYSRSCAGAWGYVVGPNSPRWKIHIAAHRLDDDLEAPSSFQGVARPNSWGNAMSVLHGCVRAEAWVDDGPRAVTSCFDEAGPVRNATGPVVHRRGR
ncbi:MAG TPA: hypothetical protein VF069_17165 [Streptosporangiaceae bacterium]